MQMKEGKPDDPTFDTTFKVMPCPPGAVNLRAYVVSCDGQIERGASDVTLKV